MKAQKKNDCTTCKFLLLQDHGYSNYTVEGTDAHCILDLNPNLPQDHWYGENPTLQWGSSCKSRIEGEPIEIDVDQEKGKLEHYAYNDRDLKALLQFFDHKINGEKIEMSCHEMLDMETLFEQLRDRNS